MKRTVKVRLNGKTKEVSYTESRERADYSGFGFHKGIKDKKEERRKARQQERMVKYYA